MVVFRFFIFCLSKCSNVAVQQYIYANSMSVSREAGACVCPVHDERQSPPLPPLLLFVGELAQAPHYPKESIARGDHLRRYLHRA